MTATTAYQAGLETTNTQSSYGLEAIWGTLPTTTFQAARVNSFSGKHVKTRSRPPEIRGDRQAAPAVTTQEVATASLVMPVYAASGGGASPVEDFLSSAMGADWGAIASIVGVGGDIALNSSGTMTSTTSGKFSPLKVGQAVKLNGFTNATNNAYYTVVAITSPTNITIFPLGGNIITETPAGTAASIVYSNLRNGTIFKSLTFQERLDPGGTKWFRYLGSYINRAQLSLQLGQYAQATFSIMLQAETKGTADASTGGIVAAPSTFDIDPIAGFGGVFWNNVALGSGVDQLSLDINNDGAAGQFALGSPLAVGMIMGTHTSNAKVRTYFRDFTLYDSFRAETAGVLTFRLKDGAGASYVFNAPNAKLMLNNGVPVDGPNKSLMADYDVEFNPDPASGITLSIDRFLAGS